MIVHDDELCTLYLGDCVEVMRELPADSIDAIVTDPPYGLEFMGKEWDRLDAGLPQENVWKGRHGKGGSSVGTDDSKPASRHHVSFGSSSRAQFKRCATCGKRQFSGTPCKCEAPEWVIEHAPPGPPSGQIRMQRWHEAWAREAFRVAKPGAHLLAFGGTRTYHRLASAIEDAGWEIRDCLVWAYASGFPKSLDVSKAIDKAAGAEREVVGVSPHTADRTAGAIWGGTDPEPIRSLTAPATPDAEKWNGWGTALKPAWEPIVMARKPLRGTVAANVLAHGTGALNIDATRIGFTSDADEQESKQKNRHADFGTEPGGNEVYGDYTMVERTNYNPPGRWPANLLLTDPIFDGDTPGVVGGGTASFNVATPWRSDGEGTDGTRAYAAGIGQREAGEIRGAYGDSGTYSRFFLIPKSSRSDREPVLRESAPQRDVAGVGALRDGGRPSIPRANQHPTVKPLDLMRHLVRLVTPPGGTVLDCFLGSGTTAIAANAEGFRCIGIEREREYLDIALARMAHQPLGLQL